MQRVKQVQEGRSGSAAGGGRGGAAELGGPDKINEILQSRQN